MTTNVESTGVETLLNEGTPEAAARLRALADSTGDKETRKAARRALYRLAQQGVTPPEPHLPVSSSPVSAARDDLRAWASACDGAGNRLLVLTWPDPDGGSPTLLQTLLNDSEGIRDADTRRLPRRELAERLQGYEEQLEAGIAVAPITPDYGRYLLAQARVLNQQHRRQTPPGFLELLHVIGEPKQEYARSPVWNLISPEEIHADADLPRDPAALFKMPWFEPWFLDVNDVFPWVGTIYEFMGQADSSDAEKQQRLDDISREAANSLLKGELAARYIRRLEEAADVLLRRDKTREGRMALHHALALQNAAEGGEVPFAVLLVQRTLQAAIEMTRARMPVAP